MALYADENNLSHENPAVISDTINKVNRNLGDLSVVRGNKHTFLGTNIDIKDNIIHVDMVKHL